MKNELRILKGEGEHRDSRGEELPPPVIYHPLRTLCNLIKTCMIVRPDMILCVPSKVVRYQLGKVGVDELIGL